MEASVNVESNYDIDQELANNEENLSPEDLKKRNDILIQLRNWRVELDRKAKYEAQEVEREMKKDMFADLDWPKLEDPIDDPSYYNGKFLYINKISLYFRYIGCE